MTQAGPFPVGVTTLVFTKPSVTTGAPRPLVTDIWYPAKPGTGTSESLGRRDAKVLRRHWPLVIFSHGNCDLADTSSFLTKALASWGFVVAGPAHFGDTPSDGLAVCFSPSTEVDSFLNRPADVSFTIDSMLAEAANPSSRFAARLNAKRIGGAGWSFGGLTTILVAQQEPRVRAALSLAGGAAAFIKTGGITIATMVQGGELDTIVPFPLEQAAYTLLGGPRFLVEILNIGHSAFADMCAEQIPPDCPPNCPPCPPDCSPALPPCIAGSITQDEAHRLVERFAVPFFLRYLGHQKLFGRLLTQDRVAGVVVQAQPRRPSSPSGAFLNENE